MNPYIRRFVLPYILSPYGLAVVPSFIFLIAWTFPPDVYSHYIREPDLMYLNPLLLVFFIACVAAFFLGVRVIGQFDSTASTLSVPKLQLRTGSRLLYLLVPLFLAAGPCFVYMLLIGGMSNFGTLIVSQQGAVVKQTLSAASGYGGSSLFVLLGTLWWALFRANQVELKGISARIFYVVFLCCFGIDFITCLATFDRTNLMPLLGGSTAIYLFFKTRSAKVNLGRLALTTFGSLFATLGAFMALQFARGASRIDAFVTSMLGYTIVSFNRLTALVLGTLHYVYSGKGGYMIAFITEMERLQWIRERMGLPTSYDLYLSEFSSLTAAGLNSFYNWAGVFGYVFVDLGWWTPLYMFAAGILAGFLWSRFRAGTPLGIVFYPWMAFWILFWFGWNLLFDQRCVGLVAAAGLLYIYDKINLRPVREASRTRRLSASVWEPIRPAASAHRGGLL